MKRRLRLFAVVSVIALAMAGCSAKSDKAAEKTTGKYGSGVDLDVGKTKKAKQATAAPAAPGGTTQQAAGQQQSGAHKSSGSGFKPDLSRRPIDGGSAGVNAHFFLNRKVPRLVIEIDAVSGHAPSPAAIALLRQRITGFVDKPGGVQVLPVQTIPGRDTWSEADAQAAEEKYRDTHNSMELSSIYLLYVDGEPARQGPIGVAYSGSSAIIYIGVIRGIGTPVVGSEGIEKATVIHEVGHLFALVNQTYQSPRDHEDPEHRGHSSNNRSVMYWAVESVNVVALLGGNTDPPNAFDADDLADLQDLKTGKLP